MDDIEVTPKAKTKPKKGAKLRRNAKSKRVKSVKNSDSGETEKSKKKQIEKALEILRKKLKFKPIDPHIETIEDMIDNLIASHGGPISIALAEWSNNSASGDWEFWLNYADGGQKEWCASTAEDYDTGAVTVQLVVPPYDGQTPVTFTVGTDVVADIPPLYANIHAVLIFVLANGTTTQKPNSLFNGAVSFYDDTTGLNSEPYSLHAYVPQSGTPVPEDPAEVLPENTQTNTANRVVISSANIRFTGFNTASGSGDRVVFAAMIF